MKKERRSINAANYSGTEYYRLAPNTRRNASPYNALIKKDSQRILTARPPNKPIMTASNDRNAMTTSERNRDETTKSITVPRCSAAIKKKPSELALAHPTQKKRESAKQETQEQNGAATQKKDANRNGSHMSTTRDGLRALLLRTQKKTEPRRLQNEQRRRTRAAKRKKTLTTTRRVWPKRKENTTKPNARGPGAGERAQKERTETTATRQRARPAPPERKRQRTKTDGRGDRQEGEARGEEERQPERRAAREAPGRGRGKRREEKRARGKTARQRATKRERDGRGGGRRGGEGRMQLLPIVIIISSSCAGLTRASMRCGRTCGDSTWIAGSSPAMTG